MKEQIRLNQKNNRPIYQISLDGTIKQKWFGAREASKKLDITQSAILNCLKHRRKTYKNFIWIYVEEYNIDTFNLDNYKNIRPILKIIQFNLNLKELRKWNNSLEISKTLGFNGKMILKCCKNNIIIYKDFVWMFLKDVNNENIKIRKELIEKLNKRYICLIDEDNNIIKQYNSTKLCSKDLNIDQSSIKKVCDGKRKTVGGYIFKYGELIV